METSTVTHVKSLVYTMFASMFVIQLRASAEICLSICPKVLLESLPEHRPSLHVYPTAFASIKLYCFVTEAIDCLKVSITHQGTLISSSLTFSQSKLQDYKRWTSALCAVSVYLSAFAQCQIILLDDTDSGVQESVQRELNSSSTHTRYTTSHHPSVCPLVHRKTLWQVRT